MNFDTIGGELYLDGKRVILENSDEYREIVTLKNLAGTQSIDIADLVVSDGGTPKDFAKTTALNDYRVVNINQQKDTTTRTGGGTTTFSNVTKLAGSKMMMTWHVPSRSSGARDGWDGVYISIDYSINNGSSWVLMGNTGYDGGIMCSGGYAIGSDGGRFLFDAAAVTSATQLRIRYRYANYGSSNTTINGSHNISTGALGWAWTRCTLVEYSNG